MNGDDELASLREALNVSPDNLPLRLHLAEMLLSRGNLDDAEKEYRRALTSAPNDAKVKLGLATTFSRQGKASHALVLVEELVKSPDASAKALVLHTRLLLKAGEVETAVRQYKKALARDASSGDPELTERLGVTPPKAADEEPSWTPESEREDREVIDGRVRTATSTPGHADTPIEKPVISFKDVGGMDTLKEEIRMKIIHPLAHPELYKAYGKAIGGGILMYGPPGCGKTHLARATAGEIKASFIAVGINDVLEMWVGNSERNLNQMFAQARRNKPCVLFFDEVDALAASRTDMRQSTGRQLINQFLSEMDGVKSSNEGVLILAATNAPWHLDSAFRRPGRFDRILFVPPPDAPARAATLKILLAGKPLEDIDYDWLAKKTVDFSGADLKAVVDQAIEAKLRDALKEGRPRPLTTKDLATSAASLRPSTREWFATARNYALYSNQGGVYDDIVKYLKL